ncbi:MAG: hypothetical protein IPG52_15740 [Rhodocyclaceae bacterium]|nr:hypothetical protein [Rhodocyclaceae bacterium]
MKIPDAQGLDPLFVIVADPADEKGAQRACAPPPSVTWCSATGPDRLLPAIDREVRGARQRADLRAALAMAHDGDARFGCLASSLPGMAFHLQRLSASDYRLFYVSEGCQALFGLSMNCWLHRASSSTPSRADDRRQLETAPAVSADRALR